MRLVHTHPPAVPTAGGTGRGMMEGSHVAGILPPTPGQQGRLKGAVRRNWAQLTHLPLHPEN